jgi:AcrR family transcriptional regulator
VARKARVNETTLFRLFKNKQDLYLQVLDGKMGFKEPERMIPILQMSDDPRKVFLSLAERLEEHFDPIFVRLMFYAALEKPELLRKRYRASLVSFYEVLGRHIRQRIDTEILRDIDPMLMGRALVGMIAYHRIVCALFGGADFPGCTAEGTADVYTDIWLRGALAWQASARVQHIEKSPAHPHVSATMYRQEPE